MKKELNILAIGDLSFMGSHTDIPSASVFEQVISVFAEADLVIGNLEGPLLLGGDPVVGKCTLYGHPGWAKILRESGIGLVTLANNHLMDYGEKGLFETIRALNETGIIHVGAGRNIQEANAPVFVEVEGRKIAFLARTTVEVSSPSYASNNSPGVAFLAEDEVLSAILRCAQEADFIVVMIHWGIEHYHYPSPQQRRLAAAMIKAGANVILGHHPHVLQGIEKISDGLVAYSLGNFLFDEFIWQANVAGHYKELIFTLSKQNREGIILRITQDESGLSFDEMFINVKNSAEIALDNSHERSREFKKFCNRLRMPVYNMWWKFYAIRCEWDLRISKQYSFKRLCKGFFKIRPRHFVEFINSLKRSGKITSGKSTNPYE